jgi:hypothetical protein
VLDILKTFPGFRILIILAGVLPVEFQLAGFHDLLDHTFGKLVGNPFTTAAIVGVAVEIGEVPFKPVLSFTTDYTDEDISFGVRHCVEGDFHVTGDYPVKVVEGEVDFAGDSVAQFDCVFGLRFSLV